MQSMFRLAWSTESPCDKIMEKATLHKSKSKSKPIPMLEIPNFMNKIKRKRTESPEPALAAHAPLVKKFKSAQGEARPALVENATSVDIVVPEPAIAQPCSSATSAACLGSQPKALPASEERSSNLNSPELQPSARPADATNLSATTMESGLTPVQQAIEAQINYEILLKHNELRLIEQELAKCQTALEQLRRCSLIPYPGSHGLSENISMGTGPFLQPSLGQFEPPFAAPWGVTDGPYTRHYAKWLISDVKFDPTSEPAMAQQAQSFFGAGEGRATRGSFADYASVGRGRTSRTSTGMLKLTPLGETPAPAPKIDPLLHKRSTDGQWVRLYCAKCGHSNFSNTQGFLNHCRIKHGEIYKSHDQAAIACGVPVDANEIGNPVAASEPAGMVTMASPVSVPALTTPGIVHPLATQSVLVPRAKVVHRALGSTSKQIPTGPASCFESSSTPYLMARAQSYGFQGNLQSLVDTTTSKVDLDAIDNSDDDSADTSAAPTPVTAKPAQLASFPLPDMTRASKVAPTRPVTKKGTANQVRLPMSFPAASSSNTDHHLPHSPAGLSPHTAEYNPGLVSDHDDDEDDEDVDDARSQPDLLLHNDHVVVEDSSDVEGADVCVDARPGLSCYEKGETSRKH